MAVESLLRVLRYFRLLKHEFHVSGVLVYGQSPNCVTPHTHTQSHTYAVLKNVKKIEIAAFFKRTPLSFMSGNESAMTEGSGRTLLGDNAGGMAVMLRSIMFQCVGVRISSGFPCIYTCT